MHTGTPLSMEAQPAQLRLREVGLRDGLQCLERPVPTAFKCDWILLAYAAGLRCIDVGCYARPERLPQMADTPEVVAFATTLAQLQVCVQVHDLEGAARALDAGVAVVTVPVAASDRYGSANVGRDAAQMLLELRRIRALRDGRHAAARIEVGIATAFGCVRLGPMAPEAVLSLVRAALDAGADQVGLADTFGQAAPDAVRELFARARELAGPIPLSAHLHAGEEGGLDTVEAAIEAGATRLDASLAGLGGSRLVPGMHGNVCLEDVEALLRRRGLDTGVELQTLHELRRFVGARPDALSLFGAVPRAAELARRARRFDQP